MYKVYIQDFFWVLHISVETCTYTRMFQGVGQGIYSKQPVESTTLLSNHNTHYINNMQNLLPYCPITTHTISTTVESTTLLSNHNTHYINNLQNLLPYCPITTHTISTTCRIYYPTVQSQHTLSTTVDMCTGFNLYSINYTDIFIM